MFDLQRKATSLVLIGPFPVLTWIASLLILHVLPRETFGADPAALVSRAHVLDVALLTRLAAPGRRDIVGSSCPDDFLHVQFQVVSPTSYLSVLVLAGGSVPLEVHDGVAAWGVAKLIEAYFGIVSIWKEDKDTVVIVNNKYSSSSNKVILT